MSDERKKSLEIMDQLLQGKRLVSHEGVIVQVRDNSLHYYDTRFKDWRPYFVDLKSIIQGDWKLYGFNINESLIENIDMYAGKYFKIIDSPLSGNTYREWFYLILDSENMCTYRVSEKLVKKSPEGLRVDKKIRAGMMLARAEDLRSAVPVWEDEKLYENQKEKL